MILLVKTQATSRMSLFQLGISVLGSGTRLNMGIMYESFNSRVHFFHLVTFCRHSMLMYLLSLSPNFHHLVYLYVILSY